MTIHHRLRAGAYGATYRPGRIIFADVEAVKNFHAVSFTDEQLAAATTGLPDRLVAISMPKPETVEAA